LRKSTDTSPKRNRRRDPRPSLALRVSVYQISLAAPAAAELASGKARGDRLNSGE